MWIGNTNINIENNVSEYINKLSFISVLWIFRVTSSNDGKTIILVRSSFKFQIELLVSYSKSTNVNVIKSFPNSKFEGNFSTYVFGKVLDIIESWKVNVGHRDNYYAKKY